MTPPPPRAALFDIGNVLIRVDFVPALRRLVPDEHSETEALLRIESLLEKKDEYESGQLSDQDFVAWASQRLGYEGSHESFRATWNSIFTPIEPMWEVAKELRDRGLLLLLFSNTNGMHVEWLLETHDVFEHFDHRIFSHEVGAIKPDEAIYHHAIDTYGLDPATTLYIDDLAENIEAGERLGFRTHRYEASQHEAFLRWLENELQP